jgi:hypothetical protein
MGKHRNDPNMEKPDRDPDTELTFQLFRLLNRVVSLLGWLLIPLVGCPAGPHFGRNACVCTNHTKS